MQKSLKKSLNEMALHERMEYQRIHDRKVILEASMYGVKVELKSLAKRDHPLDPKYVGRR